MTMGVVMTFNACTHLIIIIIKNYIITPNHVHIAIRQLSSGSNNDGCNRLY